MKHNIAKYLMNRAIDDGRPLPDWLARVVAADPTLQEHESAQRELISRLQADANAWAVAKKPVTTVSLDRTRTVGRSTWTIAVMATCACAIVGAALYFGSGSDQPLDSNITEAPAPEPFDPADVNDALDRGREMMGWMATDLEQYSKIVPANSPDELGKLTRGYVREAGSIFGRGLALLDRGSR